MIGHGGLQLGPGKPGALNLGVAKSSMTRLPSPRPVKGGGAAGMWFSCGPLSLSEAVRAALAAPHFAFAAAAAAPTLPGAHPVI